MSREFKTGDKVYYPSKGTRVFTVSDSNSDSILPIAIYEDQSLLCLFNRYGSRSSDVLPSIFHATPENQEKLEALYGRKFEAPPVKPTSRDIIQALLNSGQKYVPCYVSSGIRAPNGGSYLDFIVCVHNDGRFYNKLGEGWKYATPFDPSTGEPITEMPEGVS